MRVVCDTNVLISGILFGGPPRRVLQAIIDRHIRGFLCPTIEQEVRRVLARRKFALAPEQVQGVCQALRDLMEMVLAQQTVSAIRQDPTDNAVLACALAAKADCIVSGDRHLLTLGSFRGIEIVRPAALLARLA
jgi:putative PIN family toxin of toxin-antitoxin system